MQLGEDRKREESEFHDRREQARRELSNEEFAKAYPNGRFYRIARKEAHFLETLVGELPRDAKVLDYCVGPGMMSLRLARAGANVWGFDISPESVKGTQSLLESEGLADRGHFEVMDAENLTYPGQTFDLIICSGVLHHLDVNAAFPQIARVLKPNGKVYCIEALGYNPLINLYRKFTPGLRTAWEVDHILTHRELRIARKYFKNVDVTYLYLASLLAVPFANSKVFEPVLGALERVDGLILKIPGVQLMAWQMHFILSGPKT